MSAMIAKFLALTALSALVAAPGAHAQALDPADAAAAQRAANYLQTVTNASGRFTQTNARGQTLRGTFVIQRPGKARFDYDPPSGLSIASDGRRVAVVNSRLKTIQAAPLGMTPLSLFWRDIRLDKKITVAKVGHEGGLLTVVVRDARKKGPGQIALEFNDNPMALRGWTITDAGGGVTRLRLDDFKSSPPRDAAFFELRDPRPIGAAPTL